MSDITPRSPVALLFETIGKKHEALARQLRPGASPEELARLRALDVPDRFVELYATHDGIEGEEFLGGFGLLPARDILAEREVMNELLAAKPNWRELPWWHERWVPFLGDRGGQFHCLDPVGVLEGGRPGQIVLFDHERGPVVEFRSFDVFLELVTALAKKGLLLSPDEDRFATLYEDAQGAGTEKMPAKERKVAIKGIRKLEADGRLEEALAQALSLATQHAADQELWLVVSRLAERLARWELMARAAAAVVRLTRPTERYVYFSALPQALHNLGRDVEALAALRRFLKTVKNDAECSLAIPGHNQRARFAKDPALAGFQERCLTLWTELHPRSIEGWWALTTCTADPAVRTAAAAMTVELCTDERAQFNSWVLDRRKAAQALLGH